MPSPIAEHLADRFASDARALRARADALAAAPRGPGDVRPVGPNIESTRRMAAACDRVQRLFAEVASDDVVGALLPTLAGLVAGARTDDERHVYAGAVSRLSDALGKGEGVDADAADDDDAEDDA